MGGDGLIMAMGLERLSGLVQRAVAQVSERHELTPVQARLLCALAAGPRRMADLARHLGVEKAALTGLVDRVERRGLVRRTAVPEDRRALCVTLTGTGERAATAYHDEMVEALNRLLAPLTPEELRRFRGAITRIVSGCAPPGTPASE